MSDIRPRIRMPQTARPGEVIVIRTLVQHPMENGLRRDAAGAPIPRRILNRFTCTYGGSTVIDIDLGTAVSINPYLEFTARAGQSGEFVFTWHDDDGSVHELRQMLTVA